MIKILGFILILIGIYKFHFEGWNMPAIFLILLGIDSFLVGNDTKLGKTIHKIIFITAMVLFVLFLVSLF